ICAIAWSMAEAALARKDAAALVVSLTIALVCALVELPAAAAIALVGATFIGLSVWAINYGQRRHHRVAINLGIAAFGMEVLYIYFQTVGSLLNTALFFLAGGIVLVLMAVMLERVRRRLVGSGGGPAQ